MDCIHHWIITEAYLTKGEWSSGKCQKCGAIKDFRNTTPIVNYGRTLQLYLNKEQ